MNQRGRLSGEEFVCSVGGPKSQPKSKMAVPIARKLKFNLDSDDFIEYANRFDNFLIFNKISDEDLERSTFIATSGGPAYKLLRSLCKNETQSKTYKQLMDLMTDHLNQKPNEIVKRFSFYKGDRKSGESVNEYIAELRRLSERRKSR